MKKILASLIFCFATNLLAQTKETITLVLPGSAANSMTPLTLKMIDKANEQQNKYTFIAEFKPGGNGTVGMKYMDISPMNRVVGVAPAFVENARSGVINENDYIPIHAAGDVCWAVITNVGDTRRGIESLSSLKGKEILVGGTGYGNAAHITSLLLAEKYGFKVKYVVFKSNLEAVINMVGDNGINMALESVRTFEQMKAKQPKLQMLGFNCPSRTDQAPELRTLREQGISAPTIWNLTMANRAMPEEKRKEIGLILETATKAIGPKEFFETAGLVSPLFRGVKVEDFARDRINLQKELVKRFEKEIEASK